VNFIFDQTKRKFDIVPSWVAKKGLNMQLTTNKLTSASTNTKRSVLSYKAL